MCCHTLHFVVICDYWTRTLWDARQWQWHCQMSDAAEVSSWCQEMDGYTRSRWERCRTPMGTVPLSVIHGFDYTVCESSPGLLKDIFCVLRFCNLISYYFILVQSLIKNSSTYSTEATTKRRSLLWPESFAAKVLFLSIISRYTNLYQTVKGNF